MKEAKSQAELQEMEMTKAQAQGMKWKTTR
jgi:hypothetical protein